MARTHSSHTASPTRFRSPQQSPTRGRSQDGSQYEMDLDALGLNSTFESTELEKSHEPPVDRVDTSEIEGPDDFTMNMTYWMTADLPPLQIKSRKEANAKSHKSRSDPIQNVMVENERIKQDTKVSIDGNESTMQESVTSRPGSPIVHANGTTDGRDYSTPASDRSMENDEKVRSFLSALPDTEMEGALTGTPLHVPRHNLLQIPRPSPPKARSLQPTVEDYDTPRKVTQETVVHHTSIDLDTKQPILGQDEILRLQTELRQQEAASTRRITELETILSYTRTELTDMRTSNYHLQTDLQQQNAKYEAAYSSSETQLKIQGNSLESKMQDFGEEMRLQSLARLQKQREEFGRQLKARIESNEIMAADLEIKGVEIDKLKHELRSLQHSTARKMKDSREMQTQTQETQDIAMKAELEQQWPSGQLRLVQDRAKDLQSRLEAANLEARKAREDAQSREAKQIAAEATFTAHVSRIAELEHQLQNLGFDLECAQADGAAKHQLFHANIDLNDRLRTLKSSLETAHVTHETQQRSRITKLEAYTTLLQSQLACTQDSLAAKDLQISEQVKTQKQVEQRCNIAEGRIDGLEASLSRTSQQLANAFRDSAKAKTEAERLEQALQDSQDYLKAAHDEADRRVANIESRVKKFKESAAFAEHKCLDLESQHSILNEEHEKAMEDVRSKAEAAVKKVCAQLDLERGEKRRLVREYTTKQEEVEKLRTAVQEHTKGAAESEAAHAHASQENDKDIDGAELRNIIRRQVAETKTLNAKAVALKKENARLRVIVEGSSDLQATCTLLESQITALRLEKSSLHARLVAQEKDFEAVNATMDQRLATMLNKVLKDRAKTLVTKRDHQWVETVGTVQTERELLGKVLLRQWGREEVGIADEELGQRQEYLYKYTQHS